MNALSITIVFSLALLVILFLVRMARPKKLDPITDRIRQINRRLVQIKQLLNQQVEYHEAIALSKEGMDLEEELGKLVAQIK